MLRRAFFAVLLAGSAYGCECRGPSVQVKKDGSDIVFRGTVIAFRASPAKSDKGPSIVRDTGRIAVFRVTRVWKGEVKQTLEMPEALETTACMGFLTPLKVGEDLLVYANKVGSEYYTSICGFYKGSKNKDRKKLGSGREPTL